MNGQEWIANRDASLDDSVQSFSPLSMESARESTNNWRAENGLPPIPSEPLLQLAQQNDTPEDALSMLKRMADEDPVYKELYVQLLAERENQERAYQWYEDFNNSYYQRSTEDLKKAGLNPWLALQSLGSAGSGSLTPAGTWSGTSGSTASAKKREQQMQNNAEITSRTVGSIGTVLAAIFGALIMALA